MEYFDFLDVEEVLYGVSNVTTTGKNYSSQFHGWIRFKLEDPLEGEPWSCSIWFLTKYPDLSHGYVRATQANLAVSRSSKPNLEYDTSAQYLDLYY